MKKKNIGLVYGGKSSEHEVSLRTAFSILNSIDFKFYNVTPFYIDLNGIWNKGELLNSPFENLDDLKIKNNNNDNFNPLLLKNEIDVFFPAIHGPYGEDGSLQGFFEILDVPYVGCGVLASSTGMDKIAMKQMFSSINLEQCEYLFYTRNDINENINELVLEIKNKLGFPCFVKPANLGSSVGITKANNETELVESLKFASKFDRRVIVEEMVEGREVEIGILGNDLLLTSSIGEVVSSGQFYDYKSKYKDNNTLIKVPTELSNDVKKRISEYAKVAFKALDGSGLSRIDFFYNEKNDKILINEINTMPGFTNFSMYPMLFKDAGIEYPELIERLIVLAFDRFESKKLNQIEAEDFENDKVKKN